MSKETVVVSKSNFSIVRKISELLKLGDDGKLDSFLTRVVKSLKNEVKALSKNLDNFKFNHEQSMDSLNDELADAKEALDDSYLNIPVDRVTTNADQVSFMNQYLDRIDSDVNTINSVEVGIEKLEELYQISVNDIKDQIKSLKTRLKAISKA